MKIEKLRIGTKVKVVNSYYEEYNCHAGDIAYITNGSCFHNVDSVLDRQGRPWITHDKFTNFSKCLYVGFEDIKILKY